MAVELRTGPFEPWRELAEVPDGGLAGGAFGATCAFVGTMRDFNDGEAVHRMVLEHYPGMTERQLDAIVDEACTRHGLLAARVIHRVGAIEPGESIVLVAVWAEHRREAFEGGRAIMEALKSRAPFWKHEQTLAGARWVEHNTPG
ncbi:MAG: molybdenum cofactor biosynthesis protein MoaE [Halofilum sp. (in: g-proteobacteria)]